ncbi:MAG TPA: OmpA family protein [Bryobacteraceae bacterium]|nr:OmpA family protein [Bryobacteraceae bacterium]
MKAFLATTCILTGAMILGGCATKKYVRNTAAPIQAKVDQVGEQTTQNSQQIADTKNQVKQVDERAQSGISAAQERASTADQHAQSAMDRANQAAQSSEQNSQALNGLRQSMANVIANIDDYKLQNETVVPFKFNKYVLTTESKADLDKLADSVKSSKRYFIAVEGFTDSTGTAQYNEALSKRRADAVVQYLVADHDIPIYRIHTIGLGEAKPVAEGHTREDRAKNRRVDVKVFSADQVGSQLAASNGSASTGDDAGTANRMTTSPQTTAPAAPESAPAASPQK